MHRSKDVVYEAKGDYGDAGGGSDSGRPHGSGANWRNGLGEKDKTARELRVRWSPWGREGLTMTMTPDRQAKYAPEHGLGRQGLAYDRLRTEWQAAGRAVPGATWGGIMQQPRRSSPEA